MRLTLKGIKRTRDPCVKFWLMRGKKVRIWSSEHQAWWRPERSGYVTRIEGAGIYDFEEAYDCTKHCGPEKGIEYLTV